MVANQNNIPPQGNPGIFDARNPTLVPNFDVPRVPSAVKDGGVPTVGLSSPAGFLVAYPRVDATANATISDSATTGDILTLQVANAVFGGSRFGLNPAQISHTYTVLSTDSITNIAEALADLFNDDVFAQEIDLRADVTGASITFRQPGLVGNLSVLSAPPGEPSKITVGGTALTGDTLAVLFTGAGLGPVADATIEADFGGTVVAADTIALTFTNTSIAAFPITKTYTAVLGDTPATVAAGLLALINADATLQANGVQASQQAGTATLDILQPGAIGNSTVVSRTVSGAETVTFTPSNGHMGGGSGQPGGVLVTSNTTTGQSTTTMATNLAAAINANSVLAGLSITAAGSGAVVSLTVPAAAEPINVSTWVNSLAPTATITGGVAQADALNVGITAAYLPTASHSVSWTAGLGETTSTLAANLAATVNADPVFIEAGITATAASNVLTWHYNQAFGQIRLTQSVSPGSETITLKTAPTETLLFQSKVSELITIGSGTTPVVAATLTATLSGTIAATDTLPFVFTNAGVAGFPHTSTYTVAAGDTTLTILAASVAAALNADTALAAANISATSSGAVVTIYHQGTIGNSTTLACTPTHPGSGTEAVAFSNSGAMSGGSGVVTGGALTGGSGPIIPTNNFTYAMGSQVQAFWHGAPRNVGADVVAAMVAQGMPIL